MVRPNRPTLSNAISEYANLDTATIYVGGCLIEGTLVSEARGTTRPFELIGASYIDPNALTERLRGYQLEGVIFRHFQPTFHKFGGENWRRTTSRHGTRTLSLPQYWPGDYSRDSQSLSRRLQMAY